MLRWVQGLALLVGILPLSPAESQELPHDWYREWEGLSADDWPWWRGPARNGWAFSQSAPVHFGVEDRVRWRAQVPGRGHSSPIVVGSRVFLTTADEARQTQHVLAYNRDTGQLLWQREVNRGAFPERNHSKNTEATPTIACDGRRLFATFYNHDRVQLVCLDLLGNILWNQSAGGFRPRRYEYGYAPSPLLYKHTVIVSAEWDGPSFLVAFRRDTGDVVWRTPRPDNTSYSSPVVGLTAGKDQLLISGANKVSSYDPLTGRLMWSVTGTTAATCGTMVWDHHRVYASGGFPDSQTIAVQADGSGQVAWSNNQKCYERSMLIHHGYLYAINDGGILFCWEAATGKERWRQRLSGPFSASPILVGEHIYWANEHGKIYVFKANPLRFDLVAENQLGDDIFASPAISRGDLFWRVGVKHPNERQEVLYCLSLDTPSAR